MKNSTLSQTVQVMGLLSVIFGILVTLFRYDGYGISDQIEQLPIILRLLNNSYLTNDFFVNASTEFGPRWYFSHFIALLAGTPDRLPILYWSLTLLANISISGISFLFARRLFAGSNLAGIFSAALVMSIPTFSLGYPPNIYQNLFIESTMAIPLIFLALYFATSSKLIVGTVIAGIAAVFHPLFGLEVGALLIIAYGMVEFIFYRKLSEVSWKPILISAGILGGFSLLWIIPMLFQARIPSEAFIEIIAFFRHPHHYVPSTFSIANYGMAFSFLAGSTVAWFWWRNTLKAPNFPVNYLLVLFVLILLGCFAGYVFVEVIPLRIVVMAQTFRLLFVIKWLGLLLMGGVIAYFFEEKQDGIAGVLLVSTLSPITTGFAFVSQFMRSWVSEHIPKLKVFFEPISILLVTVSFLFQFGARNYFLLIGFILIWFFISFDRKTLYLGSTATVILIIFITTFRGQLPLPELVEDVFDDFETKFHITYSDIGTHGQEVAEFALNNTPAEGVFLTPPGFGQFRLLAERAIIVDFKAFPFQDLAMQEWYTRLTAVYGISRQSGVGMLPPLEKNYRNISDEKVITLQAEYDISYAVLFQETKTDFPILFQNNVYKVIQLTQESP